MKVQVEGGGIIIPRCPGCKRTHVFPITGPRAWHFNGDANSPSVTPSLKHFYDHHGIRWVCHYHLVEGKMHFCSDCTDGQADKIIELPEL